MKRDGTAYYPVLESKIILRKISKKDIYQLLGLQAETCVFHWMKQSIFRKHSFRMFL